MAPHNGWGKATRDYEPRCQLPLLHQMFFLQLPRSGLGVRSLQAASISSSTSTLNFKMHMCSDLTLTAHVLFLTAFGIFPLKYLTITSDSSGETEIIHLLLLPESPFLFPTSSFFRTSWKVTSICLCFHSINPASCLLLFYWSLIATCWGQFGSDSIMLVIFAHPSIKMFIILGPIWSIISEKSSLRFTQNPHN